VRREICIAGVPPSGARPHFGIYIYIYQYTIYRTYSEYNPSLCRNICKNVGWALELVYGLRALELVYGLRSI
jgi:hypothetical protein